LWCVLLVHVDLGPEVGLGDFDGVGRAAAEVRCEGHAALDPGYGFEQVEAEQRSVDAAQVDSNSEHIEHTRTHRWSGARPTSVRI
jgi:hypothetical protein